MPPIKCQRKYAAILEPDNFEMELLYSSGEMEQEVDSKVGALRYLDAFSYRTPNSKPTKVPIIPPTSPLHLLIKEYISNPNTVKMRDEVFLPSYGTVLAEGPNIYATLGQMVFAEGRQFGSVCLQLREGPNKDAFHYDHDIITSTTLLFGVTFKVEGYPRTIVTRKMPWQGICQAQIERLELQHPSNHMLREEDIWHTIVANAGTWYTGNFAAIMHSPILRQTCKSLAMVARPHFSRHEVELFNTCGYSDEQLQQQDEILLTEINRRLANRFSANICAEV